MLTKKITALFLSTVLMASCLLGGCAKKGAAKDTDESVQNNVAAKNFMVSDTAPEETPEADVPNATDDNLETYWEAKQTEEAVLQLNFDKPTLINNIHLKEDYLYKGGNCRAYHIDAWNGEEWVKVYNSDIIRDYKLCVIDPVETTAVRLVIDETDENYAEQGEMVRIAEFSATYQPPIKKDFRAVGYVSPGSFTLFGDGNYNPDEGWLDSYTDLIFHGFVHWDYNAAEQLSIKMNNSKWEQYCDLYFDRIGSRDIRKFISIRNESKGADGKKVHMSSDAAQRTHLVDEIIALAKEKGFDGVDINYEHPSTDTHWDAFNAFLVELCDKAHAQGLLVSCATSATSNQFTRRVLDSLDQYNVMVYDNTQDYKYWHSTFAYVCQAVDMAARTGMDPAKVNIGLPFYAFGTTSSGIDWSASRMYRQLYDSLSSGDEEFDFGQNSLAQYYYNGPTMIRDKTVYAITSGCGGVMVWHVVSDIPYANKASLTRAMNEAIQEYTTK